MSPRIGKRLRLRSSSRETSGVGRDGDRLTFAETSRVTARHSTMIAVQITNRFEKLPADAPKLKRLVRTTCQQFGISRARISIGIVGDFEITVLNKRFLNQEGTTDCLSFDLSDEMEPEGRKVFDLIVNGELALREAARRGHEARAELALYITHGLLHHLGFDDATEKQARRMHRTEDEILQHLGYGLVYNHGRPAR